MEMDQEMEDILLFSGPGPRWAGRCHLDLSAGGGSWEE